MEQNPCANVGSPVGVSGESAGLQDGEGLIEKFCESLESKLKEVSKGEYNTWGFVAMFMDMINQTKLEFGGES